MLISNFFFDIEETQVWTWFLEIGKRNKKISDEGSSISFEEIRHEC